MGIGIVLVLGLRFDVEYDLPLLSGHLHSGDLNRVYVYIAENQMLLIA